MPQPAPNRWPLKALLIGVIILVVFAIKPLKVIYHQSALHQAWAAALDVTQTNAATRNATLETFAHHRDKLVALRYLTHKSYTFEHLKAASVEHHALHQALEQHGQQSRDGYFVLSGHQPGQPPTVSIWAPTSEIPGWEALIRQHDQPPQDLPKSGANAGAVEPQPK